VNRDTAALGVVAGTSVVAGAFDPGGVALVAFGAVVVAVLAVGTLRGTDELAAFAVSLGLLVATVGLARSAGWSTAGTAAALVAVGALLGYGLHRYELVALGLVEGDT